MKIHLKVIIKAPNSIKKQNRCVIKNEIELKIKMANLF